MNLGDGINWVPHSLDAAIYWAMEGWLLGHGQTPEHRNGWFSIRAQFFRKAPQGLCKIVSNCLSMNSSLEFYLDCIDDFVKPLPMDEWKHRAVKALNLAEDTVEKILKL